MLLSQLPFMPAFYDQYIRKVPECSHLDALQYSCDLSHFIPVTALDELKHYSYAPDKWTVSDILQHLIDTERILSYRALRFARSDSSVLSGFDENDYARHAMANQRSIEDLLSEYQLVRQSSIHLFQSFSETMLLRTGICYEIKVSVASLAFIIAGHPVHHMQIIGERYIPSSV